MAATQLLGCYSSRPVHPSFPKGSSAEGFRREAGRSSSRGIIVYFESDYRLPVRRCSTMAPLNRRWIRLSSRARIPPTLKINARDADEILRRLYGDIFIRSGVDIRSRLSAKAGEREGKEVLIIVRRKSRITIGARAKVRAHSFHREISFPITRSGRVKSPPPPLSILGYYQMRFPVVIFALYPCSAREEICESRYGGPMSYKSPFQ